MERPFVCSIDGVESLCMKRSPAEEERHYHSHCNIKNNFNELSLLYFVIKKYKRLFMNTTSHYIKLSRRDPKFYCFVKQLPFTWIHKHGILLATTKNRPSVCKFASRPPQMQSNAARFRHRKSLDRKRDATPKVYLIY